MQGSVQRTPEGEMPGLIKGDDGREFGFQASDVAGSGIEGVQPGARVEFSVQEQGKGAGTEMELRAIDVKVARAEGHDRSRSSATRPDGAEAIPQGGDASGTGTGKALGMEPPDEVKDDKVDEASWESFPASDPPAYSRS